MATWALLWLSGHTHADDHYAALLPIACGASAGHRLVFERRQAGGPAPSQDLPRQDREPGRGHAPVGRPAEHPRRDPRDAPCHPPREWRPCRRQRCQWDPEELEGHARSQVRNGVLGAGVAEPSTARRAEGRLRGARGTRTPRAVERRSRRQIWRAAGGEKMRTAPCRQDTNWCHTVRSVTAFRPTRVGEHDSHCRADCSTDCSTYWCTMHVGSCTATVTVLRQRSDGEGTGYGVLRHDAEETCLKLAGLVGCRLLLRFDPGDRGGRILDGLRCDAGR